MRIASMGHAVFAVTITSARLRFSISIRCTTPNPGRSRPSGWMETTNLPFPASGIHQEKGHRH